MKLTIRTCLLALIVASITVSIAESTAAIAESTAAIAESTASSEAPSKAITSAVAKTTTAATTTTPPAPTKAPTAQPMTKANKTPAKKTPATTTTLNKAVTNDINAAVAQVSEEDKILEKAKTAFESETNAKKKTLAASHYWTQLDKALQAVVNCIKKETINIAAYEILLKNGAKNKAVHNKGLAESTAQQKTCQQKQKDYGTIMPGVLKAAHMSIQQVNTELETQQNKMVIAVNTFKKDHTVSSELIQNSVAKSIKTFETKTREAIVQSKTKRDTLVTTMTKQFDILTQTHSKEVANIRSYLKDFQTIQTTWNKAMVVRNAALDTHTGNEKKSGNEEQLSQLSAANKQNTGSIETARSKLKGVTKYAQTQLALFKEKFRSNNKQLKTELDTLTEQYKQEILKVNIDGKKSLDLTYATLDATNAMSQGIQTKMLEAMRQMETVVLNEAKAAQTSVEKFSTGAQNVVGTPALIQFPDAIVSEIVD